MSFFSKNETLGWLASDFGNWWSWRGLIEGEEEREGEREGEEEEEGVEEEGVEEEEEEIEVVEEGGGWGEWGGGGC